MNKWNSALKQVILKSRIMNNDMRFGQYINNVIRYNLSKNSEETGDEQVGLALYYVEAEDLLKMIDEFEEYIKPKV